MAREVTRAEKYRAGVQAIGERYCGAEILRGALVELVRKQTSKRAGVELVVAREKMEVVAAHVEPDHGAAASRLSNGCTYIDEDSR
jgi:hypothetical protein